MRLGGSWGSCLRLCLGFARPARPCSTLCSTCSTVLDPVLDPVLDLLDRARPCARPFARPFARPHCLACRFWGLVFLCGFWAVFVGIMSIIPFCVGTMSIVPFSFSLSVLTFSFWAAPPWPAAGCGWLRPNCGHHFSFWGAPPWLPDSAA